MAPRHVALLRGINLGGKNRLPMAGLVALFESVGCTGVRTYIQSGNVAFEASAALAKALPAKVAAGIEREFGIMVPVQLRSAAELRAALRVHALQDRGTPESALHVMFLRDRPKASKVKLLDPDRSPGDRFAVRGREVYLLCPNGIARTKLTNAWFDAALGTVSTTRNWRTAQALLSMIDGTDRR
jgi:uncharacterized protein (DUF1697 family)